MIKQARKTLLRGRRAFCAAREQMEYDVVVVGGGPAGLATAIRLKQLEQQHGREISVCLLEKGSQVGANILSGNCFEPTYFEKLFPNWQEMESVPPLTQQVTQDKTLFMLNHRNSIAIPQDLMLNGHQNHGNYIISLSDLCKWMGEQASELGVDIFPGFTGQDLLIGQGGAVEGVISGQFGIDKQGQPKDSFQDSIELVAKQTVIAEGARGSLAMKAMDRYGLQNNSDPMTYGLGLKEVWEVAANKIIPGLVQHSIGWPLKGDEYGGSFMYHQDKHSRLVHLGFVVGLDYKDPYMNPYEEFQQFKTHPAISQYLEGGRCVSYGARALNEGSYFALPELTFPGGMMVGCSASMLNVLKIKGSHYALGSGIMAADAIYDALGQEQQVTQVKAYQEAFDQSEIKKELYAQRNFKNGFKKGFYMGSLNAAFLDRISGGKEPWDLRSQVKDSQTTGKKKDYQPREYPKHDGVLTFDLLDNLARSGTNHEHDQPSHLKIKKGKEHRPMESLAEYGGPEERFCPAKVYEFVQEGDTMRLQINAQNCLHCKTCSIKMVDEYIEWCVPEGAGGPNYSGM